MRTFLLRSSFFLSLLLFGAACQLIAGVKDRALDQGSGGGATTTSTTSTTSSTGTSTSTSTGGQGGTGAGGSGGSHPCPEQAAGIETVVCKQQRPSNLVVDGSSLYWINEDEGTIVTVPALSSVNSTPSFVATGQTGICGLAVAKGYAYWRTHGGGVLRRAVTGQGLIEPLAELQGDSCAISASSDKIYWANAVNPVNDVISGAPLDDIVSTFDAVANAEQVLHLDASLGPKLFWTAPAKQKIFRWTGSMISALPTGGAPCDIRTDGAHLYWTDRPVNLVGTSNLDFLSPATLTGDTTQPCALALRSPFAYWAEDLDDGRVLRKQTDTPASVEVMADHQKRPCSVAVGPDGMHVFWTTCLGGEVLRRSVMP